MEHEHRRINPESLKVDLENNNRALEQALESLTPEEFLDAAMEVADWTAQIQNLKNKGHL